MQIMPLVKKARRAKNLAVKLTQTAPKVKFYYGYFIQHCKVNPKRILMESFHGKSISDSSYAVLQEMIRQGIAGDYEIYYASDNPQRDTPIVENNHLPIKLVDVESRRYAYVLATSKYLLNNSSFPLWFIRRPEQVYVQTWHGTPLKTLGKEMRLGIESMVNVQHNFLQANWLTFPNDFTRDVIMRDYNLDQLYTGKVAMVGYPRNAVFLQGGSDEVRAANDLDGYTCFAYMPTWRGTSNHSVDVSGYAREVNKTLKKLDAALADDQKLFVNFHTMVAKQIKLGSYEHIFPFPADVGTYDFLVHMDALITDYSSVMFDYALTGKPVILFTYDKEQYLSDRGMYFSIDELPFVQVSTTAELCDCLRDGTYHLSDEGLAELHERFLKYDSPDNARLVLELLLNDNPPDVPVIDYAHNLDHAWNVVEIERQKSRQDLNAIFLSSDRENDLVVLNRAGFGEVKSAHLYDNYRDYTFLFTKREVPRTPFEEIARHFSSSVEHKIEQRERARNLANLNTTPGTRTSALVGIAETAYTPDYEADLPADVTVEGDDVTVQLLDESYVPLKLLMTKKRIIRWDRELAPDERESGRITFSPRELLCDPVMRTDPRLIVGVCLLVERRSDKTRFVARLIDPTSLDEATHGNTHIYCPRRHDIAALLEEAAQHGEDAVERIPILAKAHDRDVYITPFFNNTFSRFYLFYGYAAENPALNPLARNVRTPKQEELVFDIRIPKGAYATEGLSIRNRSHTSSIAYDVPCTSRDDRVGRRVTARFDPRGLVFDGIYWDVYLLVRDEDGERFELPVSTTDNFRHSLFFRNLQCDLGNGNVLFPYAARLGRVALTHRALDPYDTGLTKVKEWAAFACYALLLPYWLHKRIWLVYEKYCSLAQDNGFAFFSYCMEDAPDSARKHVYYVMKPNEPDYEKVKRYGRNVVKFMSFRHMLYAMAANIYVGSDAKSHLYQWRPKPSVVRRFIGQRQVFFLQHGVTAMKQVAYLFGKRGSSPMTYFLTTSRAEQKIITENFGYDTRHAPILGFSRWDLLKDTSDSVDPFILVMPTWRQWLEGVDDETFVSSEYFQRYSELISDEDLMSLLDTHGLRLKFFIHPKFSEQIAHFKTTSEHVDLIPMGTQPLNELMMQCKALVTDYSSVAWDVLYMDKPVVFYQFDQQRYLDEVGAYIDLETELPGQVTHEKEELLDALRELADTEYQLSERDRKDAARWFNAKDTNNRKRTFKYLEQEGY